MKLVAAFGLAALIWTCFSPASLAGSNDPFTPQQIVSAFTQLSRETQKSLIVILVSSKSADESKMTTQKLDAIYSTLPQDMQRDLYVKWDALSDEQRIALRNMDPSMMKSVLGAAVMVEIGQQGSNALDPVKKMIENVTSFAQESRAYVQKLLWC